MTVQESAVHFAALSFSCLSDISVHLLNSSTAWAYAQICGSSTGLGGSLLSAINLGYIPSAVWPQYVCRIASDMGQMPQTC